MNSAVQLSGGGVPAGQATSSAIRRQFSGDGEQQWFRSHEGSKPHNRHRIWFSSRCHGRGWHACCHSREPRHRRKEPVEYQEALRSRMALDRRILERTSDRTDRAARGNLPARGGSQNGNSTFQGSTSPFAQNSFLGIMSSLPPSAFSPNVATPTPPGRASRPQTPSYYPLYLPNGSINQNVGPNAPMANGQVTGGDAAALDASRAGKCRAQRNGVSEWPVVGSIAHRKLGILSWHDVEFIIARSHKNAGSFDVQRNAVGIGLDNHHVHLRRSRLQPVTLGSVGDIFSAPGPFPANLFHGSVGRKLRGRNRVC